MATDPNRPHVHLPQHDDPNRCAVQGCDRAWNYVGHQPSLALRSLSEAAPDLRPLEQHERASGAPFVPSQRDAAPATHTGRPAMHSGAVYTPSMRWILCPEVNRVKIGRVRCPFTSPLRRDVAEHLRDAHRYGSLQIGFYLRNPWFADEDRKTWTDRTQHMRQEATADSAWLKIASVQGSDVFKAPDQVECPNCPESFPQDQILTHMREEELADQGDIDTMAELLGIPTLPPPDAIWGRSINCPECHNGFIKGNIRRHMQTVHQWTGDQWEDWAESVNFLEVPLVPEPVQAVITVEDIVNAEQEQHRLEMEVLAMNGLEAVLTEWWVKRAQKEAEEVVPKAVTYGSNSLLQLGRKMAQLQGREVSDDEAMELGCWVYAVGKIERWTDAVMRGERPSDDTIYDLGIYVKMVQRIRDAGSWPGV